MALRRFIIERDIPAVGSLDREQLKGAAAKSNEALRELGTDIQWVESYVADNKTFCVYLARDEAIIHKHAQVRGPSRQRRYRATLRINRRAVPHALEGSAFNRHGSCL